MFGGLTVEEACLKFLQHPQFYQEDFMECRLIRSLTTKLKP
jgi:hypothetical protein